MTYISPFLSNQLKQKGYGVSSKTNATNPSDHHELIYENLAIRANDVKPNEAKAVVLKQDPFTKAIESVKDTKKDCDNLVNVIKTGKISDNNLGRINDLGLKAGVLLIASFLASHAKTKTQALMEFIGGASFVAAMTFWPKIFINLPARLIHGFPIDQKYISAQGDKKDFFLDNQFIVWDAQPKEDMKKYARRAGINFDSENGEEKIRRKMQKTALQNRTLSMATAGFATPLSAALIGNFLEPKVENAVINHEFSRVRKIFDKDLEQYLNKANPISRSSATLNRVFKDSIRFDDEYFAKVAKSLDISKDFPSIFKNNDDVKALANWSSTGIAKTLKELYVSKTKVANIDELARELKILRTSKLSSFVVNRSAFSTLQENDVKAILEAIKEDSSIKNLIEVLKQHGVKERSAERLIQTIDVDNSEFEDAVKRINKDVIPKLRGRIKAYLDLVNPILGSKSESVSTRTFNETMKSFFDKFLPQKNSMQKLKELKEGNLDTSINSLHEFFSSIVENKSRNSEEYKKIIKSLKPRKMDANVMEVIEQAAKKSNMQEISQMGEIKENTMLKNIVKAIMGEKEGVENYGLINALSKFIKNKQLDIDAVQSKAIICANIESRIKDGSIRLTKTEESIVRKLIYDGTISARNNNFEIEAKAFAKLLDTVLNPEAFDIEESIVPGIKEQVENLKTLVGSNSENYLKTTSFAELVKNYATRLYNNKCWMKIFGTMAIILTVLTLLIQPFFGNIKNEYPDEKKGGNK